ncbi:MAG: hypothetical protein QF872_08495, partial [Gammaproteobacteria bacterium]|nr:hypothetical protein [Gammaproteobacteria bacterium]
MIINDGQTTAPISYASAPATLASNMETALAALTNIGTGNVTVVYDAASSSSRALNFSVTFSGQRAAQDIPGFIADSSALKGALVQPYWVVQGRAAQAEEQQITLQTTARQGSFTLTLAHDSQNYVTEAIALDASIEAVQSAINNAFAGLSGAQVQATFWNGSQLTLSFGGSLAGVDVADMQVATSAVAVAIDLTQTQSGFSTTQAGTAAHTLVVDYKAKNYAVSGGLTLDMDGSRGALLEASGNMRIAMSDFFAVAGSFALSKSSSRLTLSDQSVVDVDLLTVGAAGVSAFAGLNGGTAKAVGLSLSNVSFALVVAGDKADVTRRWSTLSATAGSAGFVGLPAMTVTA